MKQINIFTLCSEITIKGNRHFHLDEDEDVIAEMQFSGYITVDATEEAIKESLDDAMQQLQSITERYKEGGFILLYHYYDYFPDFMDQIAQLVYHALNLHVSFEVQKYVDTTVAFWETIYKEDDQICNPFCEGNIKYIETIIKDSDNPNKAE